MKDADADHPDLDWTRFEVYATRVRGLDVRSVDPAGYNSDETERASDEDNSETESGSEEESSEIEGASDEENSEHEGSSDGDNTEREGASDGENRGTEGASNEADSKREDTSDGESNGAEGASFEGSVETEGGSDEVNKREGGSDEASNKTEGGSDGDKKNETESTSNEENGESKSASDDPNDDPYSAIIRLKSKRQGPLLPGLKALVWSVHYHTLRIDRRLGCVLSAFITPTPEGRHTRRMVCYSPRRGAVPQDLAPQRILPRVPARLHRPLRKAREAQSRRHAHASTRLGEGTPPENVRSTHHCPRIRSSRMYRGR